VRCTAPRTVGFQPDGRTLSWSPKTSSKEFATFQLPCGKCLECRLEYARQWAVRCIHEAQMYEQNCFITLTYSDENLPGPKLQYSDFQKFMKRLRFAYPNNKIGCFVTGEYGDKNKRPHWHAIIFNWTPTDPIFKYTSESGDTVYSSETLAKLWGKGISEYGSVTFNSAGYCARYAAKKLCHGHDGHDFEPISKKSSKHAIGKRWLEKFWPDAFSYGYIILPDQKGRCSIPRYYEKWLKKEKPDAWNLYVTHTKQMQIEKAALRAEIESQQYQLSNHERRKNFRESLRTRTEARALILREKFKKLQEYQKC